MSLFVILLVVSNGEKSGFKMKKYFLDCGCDVGQATKYFINKEKDTNVEVWI
jgi:hypothetical protein